MKQALGLAVSGTEVRLAHLVMHKGQIQIEALERARLMTTLEFQPAAVKAKEQNEAEPKDAFGLKEGQAEGGTNGQNAYRRHAENIETLYGLVEKFARKKKMKVAFNVPVSMVNYIREGSLFATQTSIDRNNGADRESGPNWALQPVKSQDGGSMLSISYERQPPTMSLLTDVRSFLRGNLYLAHMDTSEVSLSNIARSRRLSDGKLTAIIYIEDDFTRLIFMRGQELFHVSSIIHESATSPDILEVICRKMIYEQDEANMPEITSILLAGRGHRLNAKEFFAERFYGIHVDYLWTNKLGRFPSNDRECEAFSEFAIPIALAWRVLQPKNPSFIPVNLLPQELRDQQEVLKLSYHGYLLMAITGIVAFMLTWQILQTRSTIATTRIKNTQLEQQIRNNQSTVDKVLELDNESRRLSKNLMLADSLSRGHDEFLIFLKKLNSSVRRSGSLWVDEIQKQKDGFSISGTSMNRESIPTLAEKLGGASLRKVTRSDVGGSRRLFAFAMEQKTGANLAESSKPDIRIIDGNNFSRNGNLILTKESDRRPSPRANVEQPATNLAEREPAADRSNAGANGAALNGASSQAATGAQQNDRRATVVEPSQSPLVKTEQNTRPPQSAPQRTADLTGRNGKAAGENSTSSENAANGRQKTVEKRSAEPAEASPLVVNDRLATTERSGGVIFAGQENVSPARDSNKTAAGVDDQRAPQTATGKPVSPKPDRYSAYSIEAAVSYTKKLADEAAAVFRKKGLDVVVQEFFDERYTATRYRVLVGLFPTQDAAEAKAAQLGSLLMKGHRIIGL
jgi:hypothetical protein